MAPELLVDFDPNTVISTLNGRVFLEMDNFRNGFVVTPL